MNARKPSILGFDPLEFITKELTLATLAKPLADKTQSKKGFSNFSRFSNLTDEKIKLLRQTLEILKNKYDACLEVQKRPDYKDFTLEVRESEAKALKELETKMLNTEAQIEALKEPVDYLSLKAELETLNQRWYQGAGMENSGKFKTLSEQEKRDKAFEDICTRAADIWEILNKEAPELLDDLDFLPEPE